MFSGIGGFELGIKRATNNEWECVGFSEIDKYAIATYQSHFPEHKNYGDATKINPSELPDFDLLCGGFPCQAFSIAGKRMGFEDARGTLFFDIARIVKEKKPRFLFLENVKGLLNHDGGKTFRIILSTIDELGYNAEWQVLNSKHFGVPQNRERVFIIGHLRGTSSRQVFPIGEVGEVTNKQRVEKIMIDVYNKKYRDECPTLTDPCHNSIRVAVPVLTPNRPEKRQNGRRFKEDGEDMFTLTGQDQRGIMIQSHSPRSGDPTKGGTGLLESSEHCFTLDSTPHYVNKIRRLTPIECERLQAFPDGWTLGSDTQRYKQCGNAVTVNVIEQIAKAINEVA